MGCFTFLFADDTACTDSNQHLDSLGNNINQQLVKLEKWFKANKLMVNGSKTKAIFFSKKQIKLEDRPKIYIDNTEIKYVNPPSITNQCGGGGGPCAPHTHLYNHLYNHHLIFLQ